MSREPPAKLVERTFALGNQRWRVDSEGNWSALMFGWWPNGVSPSHRWRPVDLKDVPKELRP